MSSGSHSGDSLGLNAIAPIRPIHVTKRKKRQDFSLLPEDERKQVKKVNNRIAAQNLRDRKRNYEGDLESRLKVLEANSTSLRAQLVQLEDENKLIQEEIRSFTNEQLDKFQLHGLFNKLQQDVQSDKSGCQQQLQNLLASLSGQVGVEKTTLQPPASLITPSGTSPLVEVSPITSPDALSLETTVSSPSIFDSDLSSDLFADLDFDFPNSDASVAPEASPAPCSQDGVLGSPLALPSAVVADQSATMELATEPAVLNPLQSGLPYLLLIIMTALNMRTNGFPLPSGPSEIPAPLQTRQTTSQCLVGSCPPACSSSSMCWASKPPDISATCCPVTA